ncbi:MAG TPA: class I SAM-dependent methyltransferase [Spirochaetota bacterium]|mgnify:CR=1 FL=1|nr:class I SAM-dependent methyltransferase [Spirochaetota bacterium]HPC42422.1 class I SAM-dependent methyltransferase [Spirochaetota bacterium]HPL16686.1 class I SAM-dependent methyltransferase [Spirochaetota bacterium]HQF06591.1 class I SAM-dependent methyltransferase [Spirochaetota bacterium]HQH96006.1 class I SAM-dependent methyltransferase [Spirochaetota bacterium]
MFDTPLYACPLCGSGSIRPRYRIDRYTPAFTVDRCGSCGFMFMNPPLDDESIRGLYGEDYYSGRSEYSYYDEREAEKFSAHVWNKRVEVLHRHVPGGNILDVGSSFGGFLKAASRYYNPHGIEVSPYAGGYSRSATVGKIHIGTLADHPFDHDYFSVITMIEVIEHLPDPVSALEECRRLLRKGGLLMIQTANMDGLQARLKGGDYAYFMPGHLSYFSRKNLAGALAGAGFGRTKVFYPVEFGLLPKLKKSRYAFRSARDYRHWLRISAYHLISKVHFGDFAATSSMVMYAFK